MTEAYASAVADGKSSPSPMDAFRDQLKGSGKEIAGKVQKAFGDARKKTGS